MGSSADGGQSVLVEARRSKPGSVLRWVVGLESLVLLGGIGYWASRGVLGANLGSAGVQSTAAFVAGSPASQVTAQSPPAIDGEPGDGSKPEPDPLKQLGRQIQGWVKDGGYGNLPEIFQADPGRPPYLKEYLASQVVAPVRDGGSYQYLGHARKTYKGKLLGDALVFRLIRPEGGGVNYNDFVLDDARAKVVDLYSYEDGEYVSTTAERNRILSADDSTNSWLPNAQTLWNSRDQIKLMEEAVAKGDSRMALDLYGSLPLVLQKDQWILILRLRASRPTVGAGSLEIRPIDRQRRDFENAYNAFPLSYQTQNPARDLRAIEGFVTLISFEDAFRCVDNIAAALGVSDPYLNVLRAGVSLSRVKPNSDNEEVLKQGNSFAKLALEAALVPTNGFGTAGRDDAFWKYMELCASTNDLDKRKAMLDSAKEELGNVISQDASQTKGSAAEIVKKSLLKMEGTLNALKGTRR